MITVGMISLLLATERQQKIPVPHGSIKLQGADELYRIRKGDFRIIYKIEDAALIVTVIRVGNRRDVERDI